ncbi:MAG: hypothetical protein QNK04_33220 [Myxococcota bacterium]|nr:hypothetical protein [Myxococcota bacterium]
MPGNALALLSLPLLALLLGFAPLTAEAGCRPGLAPNDASSCQAHRARQARERSLRLVAETRVTSPPRRAASASPGRPGGLDTSGRASDEAAAARAATAGEVGLERQRSFQRERAEQASRESQRRGALAERSRALRGGRGLPRGTIGIGLER